MKRPTRSSLIVLTAALVACETKSNNAGPDAQTQAQSQAPGQGAPPGPTADIPAPPDVAAPPADAEKTATGLMSKKLTAGTGTVSPQRQDAVKVHYTGWTTDGKMFDSSVKRGVPAEFPLAHVIKGWTEGLQLMVIGEKRRFWIPESLAYQGEPMKPKGMLVFDVELLGIKPGKKPISAPSDVGAPPADAQNRNGVFYKMLSPGTGKQKPKLDDIVKVHYTGWTTNGEMFDSSVQRGEPAEFPLNRVIKGWSEGVQQMTVGEKARLWVPEELAYQGRPGPPAGMLVFDIELLSFKEGPKPIAPPKDVKAAPKSAKKTPSGLAYLVLKRGTGKTHPTADSRVEVHYTGWTTDGKMFDSSVQRGEPVTFSLRQVIPGWTEGLQLMVEGEKALFWIPGSLAYDGQQGRPQGTLVFEVQLLSIR